VFGCFEIGGHIIDTVKKADDLVLLTEEKNVTGDTINRSIEIRRSYGMEIYVERTKLTRIYRNASFTSYFRSEITRECGIFKLFA
jgi:hypothetical protein